MSVGTIVVIVLSMVVLVLGIFFVQQIFGVGSNAVDSVDAEVQNQIQQLFGDSDREFVIYPTSRRINLDQGSRDSGFAFSIRNTGQLPADFSWETKATNTQNCPGITEDMATGWVIGGSGSVENLGSGVILEARLATFIIPEATPLCTLEYTLEINKDGSVVAAPNIFVEIQ